MHGINRKEGGREARLIYAE